MRIWAIFLSLTLLLAACMPSKFIDYNGPIVTQILVFKGMRQMHLMHNDQVLRKYDISLGFAPEGHKQREGDGRTPEGHYIIDRKNPNSQFYLSIGISYPNTPDRTHAITMGYDDPGGDIFIHGRSWRYAGATDDWTDGCIAVSNAEMREIYAMVDVGTVILIHP